jgi:hypothetical protein
MLRRGPLPVTLELLFRAETEIRLVLIQQPFGVLPINIQPVGLTIRAKGSADVRAFVPIKPQPLQVFNELAFESLLATIDVGVFNTEHHRPASLARKQPIKQSRASVADMQMPGRRRREANTDGGRSGHKMMVAEESVGLNARSVNTVAGRQMRPRDAIVPRKLVFIEEAPEISEAERSGGKQ